jgi:hypothetical protein
VGTSPIVFLVKKCGREWRGFEEIRILLAFFMAKGFKLYLMDVKSTFLNGVLEEEVIEGGCLIFR